MKVTDFINNLKMRSINKLITIVNPLIKLRISFGENQIKNRVNYFY